MLISDLPNIFSFKLEKIELSLPHDRYMVLVHDLLWTIGFTILIISVGYTLGLYDETEDKKGFKIPKDVIVIFCIGLVLFITSFYIPIPIIHQ